MTQETQWLLQEKYGGVESESFHADVARLESGEPLAYIIGSVPFLDATIYLNSHPLIPRTETEFWVEKAIAYIQNTQAPRILDLCAGSGCIGIAVAHALKDAHVTFAELQKEHLATIGRNCLENGIDCTRYKAFQSDLFSNISGTYNFILTNPPYIDPQIDRAEGSVKKFEPHEALYGGALGMELIEKIITQSKKYLAEGGCLYIEHEPEQEQAIQELAKHNGFSATTHKDQYNTPRYSILAVY